MGVEGLRIDTLAQKLKVTKGSFYSHFLDRNELLHVLLEHWEDLSSKRFVKMIDLLQGPALQRFETVLREATEAKILVVDRIYREQARSDDQVAEVMRRIDRRRLGVLAQLFQSLGYDLEESEFRAGIIYGWALSRVHFLTDQFEEDSTQRLKSAMKVLRILTTDAT